MKRGCRIIPLFVALDTFLDETTIARAERVVEVLAKYQPGIRLTVIRTRILQRQNRNWSAGIWRNTPASSASAGCTGLRLPMQQQTGAKGIVTGESLGQVASQTLDNLLVLTDAASESRSTVRSSGLIRRRRSGSHARSGHLPNPPQMHPAAQRCRQARQQKQNWPPSGRSRITWKRRKCHCRFNPG